jgi:hypothetical protein
MSSPYKSHLFVTVALYISVGSAFAITRSSPPFSIDRIVRDAQFGFQLPLESQLLERYGEGCVKQLYREERIHTYFDASTGLWWRCKIQANKTAMQPLDEILASKFPLCDKKVPPNTAIKARSLSNIRIGDSFQHLETRLGRPSRSGKASLNGFESDKYDYLRFSSEPGTIITFYVRDKVVVGFSVSSPE